MLTLQFYLPSCYVLRWRGIYVNSCSYPRAFCPFFLPRLFYPKTTVSSVRKKDELSKRSRALSRDMKEDSAVLSTIYYPFIVKLKPRESILGE